MKQRQQLDKSRVESSDNFQLTYCELIMHVVGAELAILQIFHMAEEINITFVACKNIVTEIDFTDVTKMEQ